MSRATIDNCFQCANYHVCFLRKGVEDLLDDGHHKAVIGGKAVLKNSIPSPFFELLSSICQIKEMGK